MSVTLLLVVKLLILPPGSLLFLAGLGLIFRQYRFGPPMLFGGILGLFVMSTPAVVNMWALAWESFPPLESERIRRFHPRAIVVIGGGAQRSAGEFGTEFTVNSRTMSRLRYAAKLASDLSLPVLTSGGRFCDDSPVSEAQLMAKVLTSEFNVNVLWQERLSRNTAENARFSRSLLRKDGVDTILLVTQAYHMPRAAAVFQHAGFNVLPAPTAFIGHRFEQSMIDFLPSSASLQDSFLLVHEAVGFLWYAMRY